MKDFSLSPFWIFVLHTPAEGHLALFFGSFVLHTPAEGHFALFSWSFVLHPLKIDGIRQSISSRI